MGPAFTADVSNCTTSWKGNLEILFKCLKMYIYTYIYILYLLYIMYISFDSTKALVGIYPGKTLMGECKDLAKS